MTKRDWTTVAEMCAALNQAAEVLVQSSRGLIEPGPIGRMGQPLVTDGIESAGKHAVILAKSLDWDAAEAWYAIRAAISDEKASDDDLRAAAPELVRLAFHTVLPLHSSSVGSLRAIALDLQTSPKIDKATLRSVRKRLGDLVAGIGALPSVEGGVA
jgi:hypothetical protein